MLGQLNGRNFRASEQSVEINFAKKANDKLKLFEKFSRLLVKLGTLGIIVWSKWRFGVVLDCKRKLLARRRQVIKWEIQPNLCCKVYLSVLSSRFRAESLFSALAEANFLFIRNIKI